MESSTHNLSRPALPATSPTLTGLVMTEGGAAGLLGISKRSLQRLRVDGGGPQFVKLGCRRIGYCLGDLEAWIASRRTSSTSAATARRVA